MTEELVKQGSFIEDVKDIDPFYGGSAWVDGIYCAQDCCYGQGRFKLRAAINASIQYFAGDQDESYVSVQSFNDRMGALAWLRTSEECRAVKEGHRQGCRYWQEPIVVSLEALHMRQKNNAARDEARKNRDEHDRRFKKYNDKVRQRGK